MRILGIDPGLNITGFGCVDASVDPPALVEAGVFRFARERGRAGPEPEGGWGSRPPAAAISRRLSELDRDLRDLLERLHPGVVAVEELFAHYKHPATAIVMGHARGVILLAVHQSGARLLEYKPNEVKKSLTGHGHASKEQIQHAIRDVFALAEPPSPPDMADALAVALCAAWRLSAEGQTVG